MNRYYERERERNGTEGSGNGGEFYSLGEWREGKKGLECGTGEWLCLGIPFEEYVLTQLCQNQLLSSIAASNQGPVELIIRTISILATKLEGYDFGSVSRHLRA